MRPKPGTGPWWDQRYRDGRDGWELGEPAPPLRHFLATDPRAPQPPGRILVPGCGRGHEVALLAQCGFAVVGLDISAEALREARRCHGNGSDRLQWVLADVLDPEACLAAGLAPASCSGVVEHTCFCAIHPSLRQAYLKAVCELLQPGGWLLGLFWCHDQPDGPPYGCDPDRLAADLVAAGLEPEIWQPAEHSACGRDGRQRCDEWLGLWRRQP